MSPNWLPAFIPIAVGLDRFGAIPILAFLNVGAGDHPAGGVDGR